MWARAVTRRPSGRGKSTGFCWADRVATLAVVIGSGLGEPIYDCGFLMTAKKLTPVLPFPEKAGTTIPHSRVIGRWEGGSTLVLTALTYTASFADGPPTFRRIPTGRSGRRGTA